MLVSHDSGKGHGRTYEWTSYTVAEDFNKFYAGTMDCKIIEHRDGTLQIIYTVTIAN